MSKEDVTEDTAPEFGEVIGVQLYMERPIDLAQLPNLASNNPLIDLETCKQLVDMGILFYRESTSEEGVVMNKGFVGQAFYSQFYVTSGSGVIGTVIALNQSRHIESMTKTTVNWR